MIPGRSLLKLTLRSSRGGIPVSRHTRHSRLRGFSSTSENSSFSIYEYPTRTEPPEITITKASDVSQDQIDSSTSQKIYSAEDPFDDRSQYTKEERDNLRQELQQSLDDIKLSSLPITESVPDFIPPNVSSQELEVPETLITKLENGMRVVSQVGHSELREMSIVIFNLISCANFCNLSSGNVRSDDDHWCAYQCRK